MPIYHRLAEDDNAARRTIADALAVLRTVPDFTEQSRAKIHVQPLRLSSGDLVGMVDLEFKGPLPETVCIVSLPTSGRFRAVRLGRAQRRTYDIFRLGRAVVDGAGCVTLTDGTLLRAVEVIPARLPPEPTELDYRIVHHAIAKIGKEDNCYRSLRYGLPDEQRDMVPDLRGLDCSKLSGLAVPPLKVIAGYIAAQDPTLKRLSQQKIADTLRKFGMRLPTPRPRVKARHSTAAI